MKNTIMTLHAHMPYVLNPVKEGSRYVFQMNEMENWLFEVMTEVYIPQIEMIKSLNAANKNVNLTYNIVPVLLYQLSDSYFKDKYLWYLDQFILLMEREIDRTSSVEKFIKPMKNKPDNKEMSSIEANLSNIQNTARLYYDRYKNAKKVFFYDYKADIINEWKILQDKGLIEITASSSTHAYLPLVEQEIKLVELQIGLGTETYKKCFNRQPKGFWLPECAYFPGLEKILKKNDLEYTFVDRSAIGQTGNEISDFYEYNGFIFAVHDYRLLNRFWKGGDKSIPAKFCYREFYRDIGFDLNSDYLKGYITRENGNMIGIKYHKITDDNSDLSLKEYYKPLDAASDLDKSVDDYNTQINHYNTENLIIVYDAELFGHWWFEGVDFIKKLINKNNLNITTYNNINSHIFKNICGIQYSSWETGAFNRTWLNETNFYLNVLLIKQSKMINEILKNKSINEIINDKELLTLVANLLYISNSDTNFIFAVQKDRDKFIINSVKNFYKKFISQNNMIIKNRNIKMSNNIQ